MKKLNWKAAATLMLCGTLVFSSCIGSFALHNRLTQWNMGVSDKFVNEIVFLALNIVPVYGICYLADVLVINSIEFWSGSNPVASIGDVKTVKGENGNYLVTTLENGYSITKEGEESSMDLIYDQDQNSWNIVSDGYNGELFRINENGSVEFGLPNGEAMIVTPDAQGLAQLRAATSATYFAMK